MPLATGLNNGTHSKRMWVLMCPNEKLRFRKLMDECAKKIAAKGIDARVITVPSERWLRPVTSPEDLRTLLPQEMQQEPLPNILFARDNRLLPPDSMPGTVRISGYAEGNSGATPDAIIIPDGVVDELKRRYGPQVLRPFTQRHIYPLDECNFDQERYERACQSVPNSNRPVITLLVGSCADIDNAGRGSLYANAYFEIVRRLAEAQNAKLLISSSKRTTQQDWAQIEAAFAGYPAEFYHVQVADANASEENPYYRFLAQADVIVALDSGSMAAEAAHTGKPVYGDSKTIWQFALSDHVRTLTGRTNFQEPAFPKLDIAGGIADAMIHMHAHFQKQQAREAGAGELWATRTGSSGSTQAICR